MDFSINYSKHRSNYLNIDTREYFYSNLKGLLKFIYKVHEIPANSIAASLYCKMSSDPRLCFHNPIHILSGLDWIKDHKIAHLVSENPEVLLAFWFHNSVYEITSSMRTNTAASSLFMAGLLTPYIPSVNISKAELLIHTLAQNPINGGFEKEYRLLNDIDLCYYSWPRENFKLAMDDMMLENSGMPKKKYKETTIQTIKHYQNKGVFLTAEIKDKFEPKAQANLAWFKNHLENKF